MFGWAKFQTFSESFIKSCNKDSDDVYFLGAGAQCPEELLDLHNVLLFLPKNENQKWWKTLQPSCNMKKQYVIWI